MQKDIAEIENVQRKLTKRVAGMRGLSYPERLERLGLPTLATRRLYFDLLECYKIVRRCVRSECNTALIVSEHNPCRLLCTLPTARLNVRKHSFVERALHAWNALPMSVIQQPTYGKFKLALRCHLRV